MDGVGGVALGSVCTLTSRALRHIVSEEKFFSALLRIVSVFSDSDEG